MPKTYKCPLSEAQMETLTRLAETANRATRYSGTAPLYLALDGGDDAHPDAWLFLSWPSEHEAAICVVRRLIDYIALLAQTELGAMMVPTRVPSERQP